MPSAFPIQTSERHVRRLRLRSRDAAAARRASSTLDDALRTASIPEADSGRLLVIRHLSLGRISARASPASLALLVGHATQSAAERAVHFDQPGADRADALLFPSRTDAIVALGRRLAHGEPTGDWYWNQIVPGWNTIVTRGGQWRTLLAEVRDLAGAAGIAGALALEALNGGVLDEFIAAVKPEQVDAWWFLAGWNRSQLVGETSADAMLLPPSTRARLVQLYERLGCNDRRVTWLGAVLAVHARPSCAALPDLPQRIGTWLRRAAEERKNGNVHAAKRRNDPALDDGSLDERRPRNTASTSEPSPAATDDGGLGDSNCRPALLHPEDYAATSCAGLFFLVNVLVRLRFARFLARRPAMLEANFPARLLIYVARKAGVAEDDPVLQLLHAWTGDSDDARSSSSSNILPEALCKAWSIAIERWCNRHTAIDWRALILRPGRVHATRTQIDVHFAPDQAEIALRRHALDVDPGWVPWLGRVIRFHYVDPDERSR